MSEEPKDAQQEPEHDSALQTPQPDQAHPPVSDTHDPDEDSPPVHVDVNVDIPAAPAEGSD